MRLQDLADQLAATVVLPKNFSGETNPELHGVAPIQAAQTGQVTFLTNAALAGHLTTTGASAVIVAEASADCPRPQLVHKNPYWCFAKAAQSFYQVDHGPAGVSSQAVVAADAEVAPDVTIHPLAVVSRGAKLGRGVVLYPGVYVGPGVEVGEGCVLHANVALQPGTKIGARVLIHCNTSIGADGFGFAPGETDIAKIPQIGGVVIHDDVEIGSNVSIDRGALEDTVIGRGTKIDSHVHVGHGAKVGENCMLCGLSGIAGSAELGNWVIMAGHSGLNSRTKVTDHVQIGAMTGVTGDVKKPGAVLGFPARPAGEFNRMVARMRRLEQMEKRLKELEKKLES